MEKLIKIVFVVVMVTLICFFLQAIWSLISNEYSLEAITTLLLAGAGLFFIVNMLYYRVPAASVGVPESLISGRFKPDSEDECGCSVPIAPAKTEGLHFKWPHYKIRIEKREIDTLMLAEQEYYIKNGSVLIRGFVAVRTSEDCAYRRQEISLKDAEEGVNALIDQVLRDALIEKTLEEALNLKQVLTDEIARTFNRPAMVPDPDNPGELMPRTINDENLNPIPVSFASHNFGLELTMIRINDIKPIASISEARADIILEGLKGEKNTLKMERFNAINEKFKSMYPGLSQEKLSQLLKLTEGLSTEEKKIFGLADLPEIAKLLEGLIPAVKKIVRGGGE
jgi:regulator of protease activity HflC (stomatin/prohibitin superfamily)